jgi:hypothetical protein
MSTETPPLRPESGAGTKLQILATEHWSLLATRALTYNESLSWVIGMNRLRHAYLELHPELEPYFVTSPYDDLAGAL